MPEPAAAYPFAGHPLARHDLAWLSAAAAGRAELVGRACIDAASARAKLADWVAAGRPLIVARQAADAGDRIALGLALPPRLGKFRLGFSVERSAITRLCAAPELAGVIDSLPPAWQPKARTLLATPAIAAARPRVYGSTAMQVLTGEPCLSPGSDLDLSFAPANWPAARDLLAALAAIEAGGDGRGAPGPRIDGEVVAADGGAVAWRELLAAPERLLVKRLDAVVLASHADFRAGFAPAERCAA